jgi:hypothetical protein
MSAVIELRSRIRDFIQHPRRLNPLLEDAPNWNMLANSFDTVADTEIAIKTYEATPDVQDVGARYLAIYGILQCLYVQQDAVQSMVRAFEPGKKPEYRIESEPEANEVRKIRNKATGHPTSESGKTSKEKPGVRMSHFIVQHSMHKGGFTLMTTFADKTHAFTDVSITELVAKNRTVVERALDRMMQKLEAMEMEHRTAFKEEKLADLFPVTLDYYFEKVFAGADNPGSPDGQWGGIHLNMIAEKVRLFREAIEKRGIVNSSSNWEYYLAEVEYPLQELLNYWNASGSLTDKRAAEIFAYFLRDKVLKLRESAKELDEEYQDELGGKAP